MNTRFVIPVITAAAFHAVAFFGIPKSTVVPAIPDPTVLVFPEPPRIFDPIEPPKDLPEEQSSGAKRGEPDVARSDEPPTPPTRDPFELPEIVRTEHLHISDRLPSGPIGDPLGTSKIDGPGIASIVDLDNPPRTRSQVAPVYPYEAKNGGRTGNVLVEFTVDESGRVVNPHVVRSSESVFEAPTLRAIAKWRFEPGRKNGRLVRFRMALPVQFSVND